METNDTNKIVYKELSYVVTGLFFKVHRDLGRFCREKQYGDLLEKLLLDREIQYEREKELPIKNVENERTNLVDFSIDDKILIELKSKPFITKDDYNQIHRYLDASGFKLGMLVNFRNKYLKPIRVIRTNS